MTYSFLRWRHSSLMEPVSIASEYDDNGWEVRRVEQFADGTVRFAGVERSTPGCELSLIPNVDNDQARNEQEWTIEPWTRPQFEHLWRIATQPPGPVSTSPISPVSTADFGVNV